MVDKCCMAMPERPAARITAMLLAMATAGVAAQQHAPAPGPGTRPHLTTTAEQKRGARTAPTHAPQPELPPLVAWLHVKQGNQAAQQELAKGRPLPAPAERPAGAGRYVCAVVTCADADLDIAPLLGLRRSDVLVIAVPGPFTDPLVQALLERTFAAERFPLLLLLGHDRCRTLAPRPTGTPSDAIDRRLEHAGAEARRRALPLCKALLLLQREQLLGASDQLRAAVAKDDLRVLPAELDAKTGALSWHHQQIDVLPLAPVK
jgi:hypothetical protein